MAKINVFLFVIFVYVEKGYRFYRIKMFRYTFSEPYRYFSIVLKVILTLSDRCKIFTSDWL